MLKRIALLILLFIGSMCGLTLLTPVTPRAHAQMNGTPFATVDPYIGALGTQAALNAQATQSAYSQQQGAWQSAQNASALQAQASALQAQAAAAQAQAVAQAQQATAVAAQQQAQIAALQATADAAAMRATAVVQQTRTALEIRATQTAVAIDAEAKRAAVIATRSAVEAQDRDNRAVATSVAQSIQATAEAQSAQLADTQRRQDTSFAVFTSVLIVAAIAAVYVIVLLARKGGQLIRTSAPAPAVTASPTGSSTAALLVIDQVGGTGSRRMSDLEIDADESAADRLRQLFEE
ncbi:hypothetical protein PLCT2_00963 [Planctomycetaceae bacterium]|nr:hypothetical protein PLCT2_00963 [Planctomycetaceae bacterium]